MKKIFSLMLLCAVVMFASCSKDDDGKGSTDESVKVTGVTLDQLTLALKVGETKKLIATIAPENATDKNVTWKSSAASIAEVAADGTVTAVAVGKATITVKTTEGGKEATCEVTVAKAPNPDGFENESEVDGSSWAKAYEIASKEQLGLLSTRIVGDERNKWNSKYYKLTTDIDFGDNNTDIWTPIGRNGRPFMGHFDGGDHIVKGKLIASAEITSFGIFGYSSGAEIKKLHFAGSMDVSAATNLRDFASITASGSGATSIIHCSNTANLSSSKGSVGGITGGGGGFVIACFNTGNITSVEIAGGITTTGSTQIGCVNFGNISTTNTHAGGIAPTSLCIACWSNVNIVTASSYPGAIVGSARGAAAGTKNCYWKEVSGLDGAGLGTIADGASFTGDHPTADQIAAMNAAWVEAQPTGREYQFNATTGEIEKITQ